MAIETMRTNKIKSRDGTISGLKTIIPMGCRGTNASNSFPFNNTTNTEAASTYCKTYDLSAEEYQDVATSSTGDGYSNNYQLFPDTEAAGDYALFGASSKFGCLYFNVSSTNATYGDDAVAWYYYGAGGWTALTVLYDQTDSDDQDGDRPFQEDGYILFSAPDDWAKYTIDSQEAYWIKCDVDAAELTQIPLLDDHEHYTVGFDSGTKVPVDGTVSRGRFSWTTVSGSNNDTKFILYDDTNGKASAVKTHTQALADFAISDFALSVDADDSIGLFCTAEDGTTEYANGVCELTLTHS